MTPKNSTDSKDSIKRRTTKQRTIILEILKANKNPIAATQLLTLAQAKYPTLNKTTIYRTLDRLIEEKMVEAILLKGGIVHYEVADGHAHHHHHFVCTTCAKVYCLEGCVGNIEILLPKGFTMTNHELVLRGVCVDCNKGNKKNR